MTAETLEGIFYLMVIALVLITWRNVLDILEERRNRK